MTRLGYVQFALFLMMVVTFGAAPDSIECIPPRGDVLAVHALRDGTALVAWSGHGADYITHVRSDGQVISAELADHRLDPTVFRDLDTVPERCGEIGCGTYHGQRVILRAHSISIGAVEHALPHVMQPPPADIVPARLWPVAGELPQFVGIDTGDGPVVIDLDTAGIVWRGDRGGFAARDGAHVYVVSYPRVQVFDPLTFSMTVIADSANPDQIGGGYVWTYERGEYALGAPVVRAVKPLAAAVTASR